MLADEFDQVVERALLRIPAQFRKLLENISIVVEPEPPRPGLLGLYHGIPLTERSVSQGFRMPDQITIYQGPPNAWRAAAPISKRLSPIPCGMRFPLFRHGRRRSPPRRAPPAQTDMIQCCITDRNLNGVANAILAGVDWVQIRDKSLPARELLHLVRRVLGLPNPAGAKIIVNTRMDVALAAGAAGLHLPAGSIPASRWRTIAPTRIPDRRVLPHR